MLRNDFQLDRAARHHTDTLPATRTYSDTYRSRHSPLYSINLHAFIQLFVSDSADAVEGRGKGKLQSVMERNALDDFLVNAQMEDRDFEAERGSGVTIMNNEEAVKAEENPDREEIFDYDALPIPHRCVAVLVPLARVGRTLVRSPSSSNVFASTNAPPYYTIACSLNPASAPPRSPSWDESTTPDELDRAERDAFLAWRRELARAEEASALTITPYEKNLEVWKQLWRVVERSDLIVEILDARNPLLFRCRDLERYVQKIDARKRVLLVINKSDFLSQHMRNTWAKYFNAQGVKFLFFSAIAEQSEIDALLLDAAAHSSSESDAESAAVLSAAEKRRLAALKLESMSSSSSSSAAAASASSSSASASKSAAKATPTASATAAESKPAVKAAGSMFALLSVDDDEEEQDDEDEEEEEEEEEAEQEDDAAAQQRSEKQAKQSSSASARQQKAAAHAARAAAAEQQRAAAEAAAVQPTGADTLVVDRQELIDFMLRTRVELGLQSITVGMVGYPNVGKSSTINVLLQDHRVAVSATPGKTRHFQTIRLNERLTLCDCPGLVFPTFMASRADLVCAGVLPIDQLKVENYVAPVSVVCARVSRAQLQQQYGVRFPAHAKVDAHALMTAYANKRGYVAGHGHANEPVSARLILKDYTNGKLLYCHAPPELDAAARAAFFDSLEQTKYQPEPAYKELAEAHAVAQVCGLDGWMGDGQ